MGGSLSTHERLFVSQQWSTLLETAMENDASAEAAAASSSSSTKKHGDKADAFRLSFNEWQAFLGMLECGKSTNAGERGGGGAAEGPGAALAALARTGGAPSAVCSALAASQLHCPLVPLVVHCFAWWCGSVDAAAFLARVKELDALAGLDDAGSDDEDAPRQESEAPSLCETDSDSSGGMDDSLHGVASETSSADSDVERAGAGSQRSATPPRDAENAPATGPSNRKSLATAPPKSRRRRIYEAVKNGVAQRIHRASAGRGTVTADKERSISSAAPQTLLYVEVYAELAYALRQLATERLSGEHRTGAAAPFVPASSSRMRAVLRGLTDQVAATPPPSSSSPPSRPALSPVAAVAVSVALALHASLAPTPLYAVDGILHARRLDEVFTSAGAPAVTRCWPWVAVLEAQLVHKQHELDAQQCVGRQGQELMQSFRALREKRLSGAAQRVGDDSDVAFARAPAEERWARCMAQYIGQRHVWSPVAEHFLTSHILDADKPTVLLFFGPSGLGKSEMAKLVASAVHGVLPQRLESSGKMVYIHMPSFATKESIYSLVDPPAAHVGDGILLSALLANPDAVVVLDEFEKSSTDAVQNLWLSAFQKNGVLRSLKRAERSVSTVRATFVLTCNLVADTMREQGDAYCAASAEDKQRMRRQYVAQCRQLCEARFGDPFLNRIDQLFPFVPYSREERQDYVELTLERLLAVQAAKGRRLLVTPRCVAAMATRLRSFHAATLEELLRPPLAAMARKKWDACVLTVEARVIAVEADANSDGATDAQRSVYTLVPCVWNGGSLTKGGAGAPTSVRTHTAEGAGMWESLPDGAAGIRRWWEMEQLDIKPPLEADEGSAGGLKAAEPKPAEVGAQSDGEKTDAAPKQERPSAARTSTDEALELDLSTEKLTERERALALQLTQAHALLLEKDKEISYLKEKVLLLEKALAALLCTVMCCLLALSFVIGTQMAMLFLLMVGALLVLVLQIPLAMIIHAVGALFRFLGPGKSALLIAVMALWMAKASRSVRC